MTSADNHGVPVAEAGLGYASGPRRWVLVVTVLGSAMTSIDATVVGIALPTIGRDFGAGEPADSPPLPDLTVCGAGGADRLAGAQAAGLPSRDWQKGVLE